MRSRSRRCRTIFARSSRRYLWAYRAFSRKFYAKAKLKAAQTGGLKEKIFDWAMGKAKEYAKATASGEPVSSALAIKHELADRLVFSKLRQFFGGNLRSCITGGAALPDDIYLVFTGAGISIMQGYGLTETSPVITSNNPVDVRLGSVGKPIRNTKVRIAADGEVEAFGPGVMLGYYKKDEANKEAFTEDGWFQGPATSAASTMTVFFISPTERKSFLKPRAANTSLRRR